VPLVHKGRKVTGSKVGYIADVSEEYVATTLSLKVSKMRKFSICTTYTKSVLKSRRRKRKNGVIKNTKFYHPKLLDPEDGEGIFL
jgi:hypothetical protein